MNEMIPYESIERMATALGRAKMFGKSPEELLPLMLIAQAEGRHPAVVAMEFDVIQGRPAINSKSALARFQAAGGRIQWTKRTDDEVSAVFSHPAGGDAEITWTMKRAAQAGLSGKPNWKAYPTQMLAARVIAEGVRSVYPACLSGFYTNEEVQDMPELPPMRDVTPASEQEGTAKASDADEALKARCHDAAVALGLSDEQCKAVARKHKNNLKAIAAELEEMIFKEAAPDKAEEIY